MARNIYALLVGIDTYHPASLPQVPLLQGCVNDIRAVEAYLRERTKNSEWRLVEPTDLPWILTDREATRQAVINGFNQHLCKADSEDVVIFYYAGHGAQEQAPEEFWDVEPDHLNETLVCYDSRTDGSRDLADKELGYLISKVARNNPHIVVVLDCCHSGSGTRDPNLVVRRAPQDRRERPLSSFIFSEEPAAFNELLTSSRSLEKKTTGLVLPKGRHVLFSACRDYEEAKEYRGEDGQPRGAFSYFLLQTLQRTNGSLTYRELARNVHALVSGKAKYQSPQVEATDPEELDKPALGGAISQRPFYFTLHYSNNLNSWVIDGGVLHGIPKSSNSGDTLLAIFPRGSTPEQLRQLSASLGEARVTQVQPQQSKVEIISGQDSLSVEESYWVVVTSLPLAPLKVYIKGEQGEQTGVELARQALNKAASDQKPSLYVREVEEPKDADFNLLVREGQYWITRPADDRPVVAPIPEKSADSYTTECALQAIHRLEHIARWTNVLELSSPATSQIKPDDVEMEIIVLFGKEASESKSDGSNTSVSEMRAEYTYENGECISPVLQVKLTNKSNKTLYCNVLEISESYAIDVPFFEERSSIRLLPKGTIKSLDDLSFEIPEAFLKQGITEYKEIFKLIVSTTEFDASLLQQDALGLPPPKRSITTYQSTLNLLMDRVYSREAVRKARTYDDWMTKAVSVTIVRSHDGKPINSNEPTLLLDGVVEVQPHPSLQAKVSLTTVPQASRDMGNLILPPILREDPSVTQPFQFTTSRGSDPGLSALELIEVQDYTVVTPETPLKLLVNTSLAAGEHLLPIGYDGEFFLPLGRGVKTANGKTEIRLERLPKPTVSSRSLQGSIRIFFQKVLSQKLGAPFEYPILATAEVKEDETVIYEKSQEVIKVQVAQAQKIVLYIHGIIGDTQSMVPSIQQAKVEVDGQLRPLRELYDLVLTFDYENLQTTIEENARLLGQRLAAVGLGPNHGKELHIVAHSMGGLVSRWFIEREGGNQVVQHLVMLGTPNAGSPWPTVQDWAFATLSFGLNQLSAIVWPVKVIPALLDYIEANDNSLEQMQPDSPLLKAMAENPDPHVPYTIIAGDRSLIPGAIETQPELQTSPVQRLMQRLFGKAVDKVVDLAFFHQPNDIAVILASIKSVSANRLPQPLILLPDATCDHLTYFTNHAGLNALAIALSTRQDDIQKPVVKSASTQLVTEPKEVHAKEENQKRLSGSIIGAIALLVIAVISGLIFWQTARHEKLKRQHATRQALPSDVKPN